MYGCMQESGSIPCDPCKSLRRHMQNAHMNTFQTDKSCKLSTMFKVRCQLLSTCLASQLPHQHTYMIVKFSSTNILVHSVIMLTYKSHKLAKVVFTIYCPHTAHILQPILAPFTDFYRLLQEPLLFSLLLGPGLCNNYCKVLKANTLCMGTEFLREPMWEPYTKPSIRITHHNVQKNTVACTHRRTHLTSGMGYSTGPHAPWRLTVLQAFELPPKSRVNRSTHRYCDSPAWHGRLRWALASQNHLATAILLG